MSPDQGQHYLLRQQESVLSFETAQESFKALNLHKRQLLEREVHDQNIILEQEQTLKDSFESSGLLDKAKPKGKKKKGRALTEHLPGLDLIFGRKKVDFCGKKADFVSEVVRASAPKAPASTSATERVGFEPTMRKGSDLRVMSPTFLADFPCSHWAVSNACHCKLPL